MKHPLPKNIHRFRAIALRQETEIAMLATFNHWKCLCRETLLQALRGVIAGAGQKMGDPIRKTLTSTLLSLLAYGDVRLSIIACIGHVMSW